MLCHVPSRSLAHPTGQQQVDTRSPQEARPPARLGGLRDNDQPAMDGFPVGIDGDDDKLGGSAVVWRKLICGGKWNGEFHGRAGSFPPEAKRTAPAGDRRGLQASMRDIGILKN